MIIKYCFNDDDDVKNVFFYLPLIAFTINLKFIFNKKSREYFFEGLDKVYSEVIL